MYTIRGLARELGVPYTTLRNYVLELKKSRLIRVSKGPQGFMIDEDGKRIIEEFVELVRSGFGVQGAIILLRKESRSEKILNSILQKVEKIERDIEKIAAEGKEEKKRKWSFFHWFRRKS